MAIHIYKTEPELRTAIALYFIKIAQKAIEEKGAFHVALSGGRSPEKLYALLASDKFKTQVDWTKLFFFFVDERFVSASDSQRNSRMIQQTLFAPLKISAAQIFSINTALSPDIAAGKYEGDIISHFSKGVQSEKQEPICFDLVLLGLGVNAHTASLFPYTTLLHEKSASVKSVFFKEQNSYRISMTAPMINSAKHIAFLVYGKEKAEAVQQVLTAKRDFEKYPAQLIHPTSGEIHWFLDSPAASLLVK